MKVILLESVSNLGAAGDVVKVRPGYARNMLIPRGHAVAANEKNLKAHAHQEKILEHKLKKLRKIAEEKRSALEGKGVTIRRKSGEHEKLFGSVSTADIEESLRAVGVSVSRKSIHLAEPIKKLGKYEVPVKLDGGLEAKIVVNVVSDAA